MGIVGDSSTQAPFPVAGTLAKVCFQSHQSIVTNFHAKKAAYDPISRER